MMGAFALALLCLGPLGGCGESKNDASANAPATPVDQMLNDYEKVSNSFIKVAREKAEGDVSVTLRFIDLSDELRDWPKKHQQLWAQMTPQQAQRAAAITAKAAPLLRK
jgi:hypothetical protein